MNYVRDYLRRTGAWNADDSTAFRPMPCNKLDRFTSGIVIFAKTWDTMRIMNQKIQQREIEKIYSCIVIGLPASPRGKIESYLLKNKDETYVTVHKHHQMLCANQVTFSFSTDAGILNYLKGRTFRVNMTVVLLTE